MLVCVVLAYVVLVCVVLAYVVLVCVVLACVVLVSVVLVWTISAGPTQRVVCVCVSPTQRVAFAACFQPTAITICVILSRSAPEQWIRQWNLKQVWFLTGRTFASRT